MKPLLYTSSILLALLLHTPAHAETLTLHKTDLTVDTPNNGAWVYTTKHGKTKLGMSTTRSAASFKEVKTRNQKALLHAMQKLIQKDNPSSPTSPPTFTTNAYGLAMATQDFTLNIDGIDLYVSNVLLDHPTNGRSVIVTLMAFSKKDLKTLRDIPNFIRPTTTHTIPESNLRVFLPQPKNGWTLTKNPQGNLTASKTGFATIVLTPAANKTNDGRFLPTDPIPFVQHTLKALHPKHIHRTHAFKTPNTTKYTSGLRITHGQSHTPTKPTPPRELHILTASTPEAYGLTMIAVYLNKKLDKTTRKNFIQALKNGIQSASDTHPEKKK